MRTDTVYRVGATWLLATIAGCVRADAVDSVDDIT
jgi:hypothetical protein